MSARYTKTAKGLHWLMAVLFFGLLGLGFYMQGLPFSPDKLKYYSWHKWLGVIVFLLALVRLAWRVTHKPPALPSSMPRLMQVAAHAGHHMLYLLMFAIPLSGWLMSSAKGFQTVWFGVLPIPDLLEKDKMLGDLLQTVHVSSNFLFIAVLVGHIGAALKHHFIDKDDILTRMLPHSDEDKS
jgi:cytochrome b561